MRALLQRVDGASVTVEGAVVAAITGPGLLALIGVTHDDTASSAERLAARIFDVRVFDRAHAVRVGKTVPDDAPRELSAADLDLPVLVVSQFTLYGDASQGRRPTWSAAAPRAVAEPLVDHLVGALRARGATVATGAFGADMQVALVNDGPITLLLET